MLRRCSGVLCHEIGHLFGIAHCVWFHCLMNGSNHADESDARPWRLCPVDLHKLHHALQDLGGLDPVARDTALLRVCDAFGMAEEAKWYQASIDNALPDVADGALAAGAGAGAGVDSSTSRLVAPGAARE